MATPMLVQSDIFSRIRQYTARLVLVSNSFQLAKLQVFKRVHKFVPLQVSLACTPLVFFAGSFQLYNFMY